MLSLAHLSDIHLAPLPRVRPGDLTGKRLIGYHSWRFRRRHVHKPLILESVIADVLTHRPDHVAITGDLINISLREEYILGSQWLQALGAPDWITFVPGNHDAYVVAPWDEGMGLWAGYMTGDLRMAGARGTGGLANPFPFVRQRRNVALIGVSTAIPTSWRMAAGELGGRQLESLAQILGELKGRGFYRILLIHHPPLPGQSEPRKALLDAGELRDVLMREGAELVLHGHEHRHELKRLDTPSGPVHVVGVPSASARSTKRKPAAAWNLYEIRRHNGIWRCDVTVRAYDEATGMMATRTQFSLDSE